MKEKEIIHRVTKILWMQKSKHQTLQSSAKFKVLLISCYASNLLLLLLLLLCLWYRRYYMRGGLSSVTPSVPQHDIMTHPPPLIGHPEAVLTSDWPPEVRTGLNMTQASGRHIFCFSSRIPRRALSITAYFQGSVSGERGRETVEARTRGVWIQVWHVHHLLHENTGKLPRQIVNCSSRTWNA